MTSADKFNLKSMKRYGWNGSLFGKSRETDISRVTEEVRKFQFYMNITEDGKAGIKTLRGATSTHTAEARECVYIESVLREHDTMAGPTGFYWPIATRLLSRTPNRYVSTMGARSYMSPRSNNRHHVGVDVYARDNDVVVACEDGVIVSYYEFYRGVYAFFVQCDSGLVINYAEVAKNSWKIFGLRVGSRVKAGEPIALVGKMRTSSMLHFETYSSGAKQNLRWYAGKPKPRRLLDPTNYLIQLARHGR